jgi:hypothetical protein
LFSAFVSLLDWALFDFPNYRLLFLRAGEDANRYIKVSCPEAIPRIVKKTGDRKNQSKIKDIH